ncbi:hypothetical protein L3X38_012857 [Prunus dulcis]|uniref:Uncharacterized protein n=1 Tax=Prunus dulcis TaxID=3755 RepID=A0AAD4ZGF7_PRUDU|nr:hypothetical protein L3X38_012857 [Prunus dulcis]
MGHVPTPDNLRHAGPQHNITISPHTPVPPTPRMGSVSTPDNLRHVRPQHNITISPHTPVPPTPRMGSVSTPDNLRHARPDFHLVVLVVNPKSGEVLKVVRIALQLTF